MELACLHWKDSFKPNEFSSIIISSPITNLRLNSCLREAGRPWCA